MQPEITQKDNTSVHRVPSLLRKRIIPNISLPQTTQCICHGLRWCYVLWLPSQTISVKLDVVNGELIWIKSWHYCHQPAILCSYISSCQRSGHSPKDFMYHEYSQFQLCVDREEDKQQHVLLLFIKSNLITHNVVSLWILMLK